MSMDPSECLFCKIAKGEIPSKKIFEDESAIAFLDINPANRGHCLVVPKKHFENIYDIDDKTLEKVIIIAKNLSKLIKEKLACNGINLVQNNERHAGQIVNHFHVHIIPRYENDNVVITYQRVQLSDADFEDIQKKLSETAKKEPPRSWDFNV